MVVNSLPSPLHVDATIEALNSGFHVLSEKPLAKKVSDVDRILAAEQESGTLANQGKQFVWHVQTALARLASAGVEFRHGDIRIKADIEALGPVDCLIECSAEASVLAGVEHAGAKVPTISSIPISPAR